MDPYRSQHQNIHQNIRLEKNTTKLADSAGRSEKNPKAAGFFVSVPKICLDHFLGERSNCFRNLWHSKNSPFLEKHQNQDSFKRIPVLMLYYIDFSHHFHVVNRLFTNPRSTSPLAASTYSISAPTHHPRSNRTWMITPLGKWLVKVCFPILKKQNPDPIKTMVKRILATETSVMASWPNGIVYHQPSALPWNFSGDFLEPSATEIGGPPRLVFHQPRFSWNFQGISVPFGGPSNSCFQSLCFDQNGMDPPR